MIFTFKLSRRLAVSRVAALAGLSVLAACGGDATSPTGPEAPASAAGVAQIVLAPQSPSISPKQVLQFAAIGRTPAGDSLSVDAAWSATGGTISPTGAFSADAPGVYTVVARDREHPAAADSVQVRVAAPNPPVAPPAPSAPAGAATDARRPNQPAGFTRIVEHGFGSMPLQASAAAGAWQEPDSPNYTVVSTSTPTGDGKALQVRFPAGLPGGSTPGKFHMWSDLDIYRAPRYRQLYISMHARIQGRDFENQLVATKLFYFAYGNTAQTNDGGLTLKNGTGRQAVMTEMPLRPFISPGDDRAHVASRNLDQNMTSGTQFTVGAWHHIEVLAGVGTPDHADGTFKAWIDGVPVLDYNTVQYLASTLQYTEGFFNLQFAPVWGGNGGTRTRDDFMQVDDFYASGRP